MKIFDGRKAAKKLEQRISQFTEKNTITKELAIVQIGSDEASNKYIGLKKKICEKYNIPVRHVQLDATLPKDLCLIEIGKLNMNENISSIIIQLPLPNSELNDILNMVALEKDIDFLSIGSRSIFFDTNTFDMLPPVVNAVKYFIDSNGISLKNKNVVVIGEGFLVGKPVGHFLQNYYNSNVIYYDKEDDVSNMNVKADLVVLSAGVPNLMSGENFSRKTNIIDYGSSVVDNKTTGDLNMNSKINHLGHISPSPGGMGPLVVRFLILNHLRLNINS